MLTFSYYSDVKRICMYLTDKNGCFIKEIETSFEYSYAAACGEDVSEQKMLSLRHPKDRGWVRFYPTSDSYGPDLDDTALFYVGLLKKSDRYKNDAMVIVNACEGYRTRAGLVVTWPHREFESNEQDDFMVNLHYLWMSHLLGLRDARVEVALLKWLESDDLRTKYYHNETFILFSCLKASSDFLTGAFANRFKEATNRAIASRKLVIPETFSELIFEDGVFRHIGKEVFFHFSKPVARMDADASEDKDLDAYYLEKQRLYGDINNTYENDLLKNFDFKNSIFYKMGTIRFGKEGRVVEDEFSMFDTTFYTDIVSNNEYVNDHSLSVRVHLHRTLTHLPGEIEQILRSYWNYCVEYLDLKFGKRSPNSFMGFHIGAVDIPRHKHYNAKSTFTFVRTVGDDENDAHFVIGDERVDFPKDSKFFAIHIDGDYKAHEVIKKDNNVYIYFVFDFDVEPDARVNQFIAL